MSEKSIIAEYISAFQSCYPQKKIEVIPCFSRPGESTRYSVWIDGDKGNRTLTLEELKTAAADFLA